MTKRLTVNQVANECLSLASGLCDHEGPSYVTSLGYVEAMQDAARLIRLHLVPRWQDEPDADGWYFIEKQATGGIKRYEVSLIRNIGTAEKPNWFNETKGLQHWGRVCPIGERPEDGA